MKDAFAEYVKSFYSTDPNDSGGHKALYPIAPPDVIEIACALVSRRIDIPFDTPRGDSVDRETVRELLYRIGYEEEVNEYQSE